MNSLMKCLFLTAISISANSHALDLHFSTGFTPPVSDYFQKVLEEADKRLDDVQITFEILPAERSIDFADKGINDGDCCRIPAVITNQYPNLLVVPTSFYAASFSAFSKKTDMNIKTFSDLKPYSVGTVKGWKIAVNKVHEIQPAYEFVVTTPEQLFRMLDADRIDYGIMGYLSGLKTLADLKIENIYPHQPPLLKEDLHLMLNKKHLNYLPVFDEVFKDMIKDGTIERLYDDLIKSIR